MALKSTDQLRFTEHVCRALAIIVLPWPSLWPACLPKARRLFRMPNVFVNRIPGSKQFLKNLAIRSGCRSARRSSVHSLLRLPRRVNQVSLGEKHTWDHTLPNTVSSPLMVLLPRARAVSPGSLRDNLGLSTSTQGQFIERLPGIFFKTGFDRRKASVLLTRSIPRRSHAL